MLLARAREVSEWVAKYAGVTGPEIVSVFSSGNLDKDPGVWRLPCSYVLAAFVVKRKMDKFPRGVVNCL